MVVGITVAEIALVGLVAWVLFSTGFAEHASRSIRMGGGDAFVTASMLGPLALMAFVLAYWQWRLSGRARLRLLLVCFASLVWSFCSLCWYDVLRATKGLPLRAEALEPQAELWRWTGAALLAMAALVAGLVGVAVVLWRDRARGGERPEPPG